MNSYFIRHTKKMSVRDEDLDQVWNQNKIAIHYPGDDLGPDSKSTEPEGYERENDKKNIRIFNELSEAGGFVWAESRGKLNAKVGVVRPRTMVELFPAKWTIPEDPRFKHKAGSEAILKTLQLEDVKEVAPDEAMSLRAITPPHVTISPWNACNPRLPALVRGEPLEPTWSNLSPALQEVTCAEFLRLHENPHYPKLAFLLLPVGRTLKDIDICGVDLHEREIFAQVTYHNKGDRSSLRKVEALKKYGRPDNHLVYFCRCLESEYKDGVLYVPVEEVLDWIEENPVLRYKIFSI